jgi:hypothetical protein
MQNRRHRESMRSCRSLPSGDDTTSLFHYNCAVPVAHCTQPLLSSLCGSLLVREPVALPCCRLPPPVSLRCSNFPSPCHPRQLFLLAVCCRSGRRGVTRHGSPGALSAHVSSPTASVTPAHTNAQDEPPRLITSSAPVPPLRLLLPFSL